MFLRKFSQNLPNLKVSKKMFAWTLHSYGDIEELQLQSQRIAILESPDDVLVQVKAASLNPIDSFMLGGYGRTSFQVLRNNVIEFPLILGRDFSGIIINKGQKVENFHIGEEVYGFIPIHKQGSFAETVLASQYHILPKPSNLTHTESASLVYSTMTAWSSLFLVGNLSFRQKNGLRVLILGGSGGVGSAAIQLLKSQGCVVFTTCSEDAVPLVASLLNPDQIFNRNDENFNSNVQQEGKFHIILDAANVGIENIPKTWQYETFITLNSPLLVNNDKYGLCGGLLRSCKNFLQLNVNSKGKSVRWGYFVPSNCGFQFIHQQIIQGNIKPIIQQEFAFNDLPSAIKLLRLGHTRGKIVVNKIK